MYKYRISYCVLCVIQRCLSLSIYLSISISTSIFLSGSFGVVRLLVIRQPLTVTMVSFPIVSADKLFRTIDALIRHQKFRGSITRRDTLSVVSYTPRVAGSRNCSRSYVSYNTLCRCVSRICDSTERYALARVLNRMNAQRVADYLSRFILMLSVL